MNAPYDQQLQTARQRLQDAQARERERVQKEQAGQREIDAAKAEIAAVEQRRRDSEINALRSQNDAVIQDVIALHIQTVAALERGDVRAALELKGKADAAWEAHHQLVLAILNGLGIFSPGSFSYRAAESNRIRQVYGLGYKLLEWISQAPAPIDRQIRQGLTLAIMGMAFFQLANPAANYNADAAYKQDNTPSVW